MAVVGEARAGSRRSRALLPMSTPRVGSSSTSALGSQIDRRRDRDLLLVAAARGCGSACRGVAVLTLEALAHLLRERVHARRAAARRRRPRCVAEPGDDVVADREVAEQAVVAARRHERDALGDAARLRPATSTAPSVGSKPGDRRAPARARPSPRRRSAPRSRPQATSRSTPRERAAPVGQAAQRAGARSLETGRRRRACPVALGRADHERAGDLVGSDLLALERPARTRPSSSTTTLSACSASSPRRWLTSITVRPAVGEHVHAPEEILRLLVGERGVRLVEEHDAGVAARARARSRCAAGSRAGSSRELAVGDVEDRERRRAARARARRGRGRTPAAALAADHDVLGDGQVREELRLLVHDRDEPCADHRRPRLALDDDLARVRGRLAGEDLDHRALAGAVRAGDAEDLARARPRGRARRARSCRRSACAARGSRRRPRLRVMPSCPSGDGSCSGRAPPRGS